MVTDCYLIYRGTSELVTEFGVFDIPRLGFVPDQSRKQLDETSDPAALGFEQSRRGGTVPLHGFARAEKPKNIVKSATPARILGKVLSRPERV